MPTRIINHRTGEVVAGDAKLAQGPLARMRGLLGRRSMKPGEALVLKPGSSIHTMFMLFPIDVIYLDGADTVVKVVHNLAPFRFSGSLAGRTAVETAGGSLATLDLEPGDLLHMEEYEAKLD